MHLAYTCILADARVREEDPRLVLRRRVANRPMDGQLHVAASCRLLIQPIPQEIALRVRVTAGHPGHRIPSLCPLLLIRSRYEGQLDRNGRFHLEGGANPFGLRRSADLKEAATFHGPDRSAQGTFFYTFACLRHCIERVLGQRPRPIAQGSGAVADATRRRAGKT
jgi:hypothetical protein